MDWAGPAAGSGDGEPPWRPPPGEAELLAEDFRERAARLMRDYESSYEADQGEYPYPDEPDEHYRYPSYGSCAQAAVAAGQYRAQASAANAALQATQARELAVNERLGEARAALQRTWPWQQRKRTELRALVEDAELDAWALAHEAEFLDFDAIWDEQLCADAEWAAAVLRRREHAEAAARRAVAQTLGWRPGDALPGRRVFRAGRGGIEAVPSQAAADVRSAARLPDAVRLRPGPGGFRLAGQVMVPPGRDRRSPGQGPWP